MAEYDYFIEFLPVAINDLTEIVSTYVMLGNKNGAVRIKNKMIKKLLFIDKV